MKRQYKRHSEAHQNLRLMPLFLFSFLLLIASCAKMGQPDGGWYDETPPHVVSAQPEDGAVNVNTKRQTIWFDEFIKVENASQKVVVSPPQIEMPEITGAGKAIKIKLLDSLKANTTYTIDFSDAISDNNENNPLGNYTYTFSTGDHIDTLEVSGTVLSAELLEPVKGILVGVYDDLSDTVFAKKPFQRVSRTDSRGRFTIKGIAPGQYRIYALQDVDNNYIFSQQSEEIAFNHDIFVPSSKPDLRYDTIWRDSIRIDSIIPVHYTHYLPDDICLLSFTEKQTNRYFLKSERTQANRFTLFFSYGDSIMPQLRGLNFNDSDAFVVEPSMKTDTITYWLRDTALVNQDTLSVELSYRTTDSLGVLIPKTDTLNILSKQPFAKRMKEKEKEMEKWKKKQEKAKKRGLPFDSIMPPTLLEVKYNVPSALDPDKNPSIGIDTPIASLDTSKIHLYSKHDSLWYQAPYLLREMKNKPRTYEILAEWRPEVEYSLEMDSLFITDIYGVSAKAQKNAFKVKGNDSFSTFLLTLTDFPDDSPIIAQLLDKGDKPVKEAPVVKGMAEFFYVKPGTYYLRIIVDRNGNGVWDTGKFSEDIQPEAVYYYHEPIECKEKWDVSRSWNPTARAVDKQKPQAITKQKGEKQKTIKRRNFERAKQLGIEYLEKNVSL